ncbi:hypothetical protein TNCV_3942961 [Trichonephila clavipes]|nr:hypothetical protein TNCV_3942961 [Trichonephila clavipes]
MLQISRKSVGFHHGALGNVIVLIHLIGQVIRQSAVIQISEMGKRFQVDSKKTQLFINVLLVRAFGNDEASISLGQGQNLPLTPQKVRDRDEIRMIHRDANHFRAFVILRNAANGQFNRYRLSSMVKHIDMGENGYLPCTPSF